LKENKFQSEWKNILHKYIEQIERSFAPIPITKVPLLRREVLGIEMLKKVGEGVYVDKNPVDIFYREEHTAITKISDGHYIIILRLPFAFDNKMETNVLQLGDSLTQRIGNYQKSVILPLFFRWNEDC
jgi:arsenite-transporting ATPase